MVQVSAASTYVFYQTHTAVFFRWLNDAGDILQRLTQTVGGVFSTMKSVQIMNGTPHMSASITAKEIGTVESGLSVCRLVCDFFQFASLDLFFEIASEDTEITIKGEEKTIQQGQIMLDEAGNRIQRPWIHSVAKLGSVVGRALSTLNFFHTRTFTLSNSTFTNLSAAALINGFITAGAWVGTAALAAYKHFEGEERSIEKITIHIVSCTRAFFDLLSVTFDTATRHLASNPAIGVASSVISMVGGAIWFVSESATYKRAW